MSFIFKVLAYLKITLLYQPIIYQFHHCQNIISAIRITYTAQISASTKRKSKPLTEDELLNGCRLGIDSHADISCLGKHARIISHRDNIVCSVQPFNDSYKPINNVHMIDGAFAIDSGDGNSAVIHVNNALDFTDTMEHSILCTNQVRINGTVINDVPSFIEH